MAQAHRQRARVRTPGAVAVPRRNGNGQATLRRERVVEPAPEQARRERDGGRIRSAGWRPVSALVLSILGLADSAYLTYEHFTGNHSLVCSANSVVNCEKVTEGSWSYIHLHFVQIPVALLGLVFFAAMLALNLPAMWRSTLRWIAWTRLAVVAVGMASVLLLLYRELFEAQAICLYCTGVHFVTLVLFIVIVSSLPAFSTASD